MPKKHKRAVQEGGPFSCVTGTVSIYKVKE